MADSNQVHKVLGIRLDCQNLAPSRIESENKIDYDVKNITQYSHQNRISSILDKMYSLDFIARPEGLEPSTP